MSVTEEHVQGPAYPSGWRQAEPIKIRVRVVFAFVHPVTLRRPVSLRPPTAKTVILPLQQWPSREDDPIVGLRARVALPS